VFLRHRDPASPYECVCPMWHTSLTAAQTKALESLQRRALSIIYEDGDYMLSLIRAGFDTLEARREQLTERFFRRSVLPSVMGKSNHYFI